MYGLLVGTERHERKPNLLVRHVALVGPRRDGTCPEGRHPSSSRSRPQTLGSEHLADGQRTLRMSALSSWELLCCARSTSS